MAGRKSNLDQVIKKANEYLSGGYELNGGVIPSVSGMALYIKCSRSSLYNYADDDTEFSDMLEMIKATQERGLINKGLKGEFNATIVKLMLANHGYSDKQELDHRSSDNSLIKKPTIIQLVGAKREDITGGN